MMGKIFLERYRNEFFQSRGVFAKITIYNLFSVATWIEGMSAEKRNICCQDKNIKKKLFQVQTKLFTQKYVTSFGT